MQHRRHGIGWNGNFRRSHQFFENEPPNPERILRIENPIYRHEGPVTKRTNSDMANRRRKRSLAGAYSSYKASPIIGGYDQWEGGGENLMRLRARTIHTRRCIVFPTTPMMGRKGGFVRRRAKRRRARENDPRADCLATAFAASMVPGPAVGTGEMHELFSRA